MKRLMYVAIGVALLSLTGCDEPKQVKNPEIYDLGTFDGCGVKYVNRGYKDNSFYIARCGTTSTATGGYETGGKPRQHIPQVTIVDEGAMDAQIQALQEKKAALNKLTPRERELLGIKK